MIISVFLISSTPPDVEYRRVDSRDSQRRMYEELQDSEYAPTAHQSTLQSPSLQALARSSAYCKQEILIFVVGFQYGATSRVM